MKIIAKYLVLFIFLISFQLNSQRNEIGLLVGGSNYIGDVGPTADALIAKAVATAVQRGLVGLRDIREAYRALDRLAITQRGRGFTLGLGCHHGLPARPFQLEKLQRLLLVLLHPTALCSVEFGLTHRSCLVPCPIWCASRPVDGCDDRTADPGIRCRCPLVA